MQARKGLSCHRSCLSGRPTGAPGGRSHRHLLGNARLRRSILRLCARAKSGGRTWWSWKSRHDQRAHWTACLPSLIHGSAVPCPTFDQTRRRRYCILMPRQTTQSGKKPSGRKRSGGGSPDAAEQSSVSSTPASDSERAAAPASRTRPRRGRRWAGARTAV